MFQKKPHQVFFFFLLLSLTGWGQNHLILEHSDSVGELWTANLETDVQVPYDVHQVESHLRSKLPEIWGLGYYQAGFTLTPIGDSLKVTIDLGPKTDYTLSFQWEKSSLKWLNAQGKRLDNSFDATPQELKEKVFEVLAFAEEGGYPFAQVRTSANPTAIQLTILPGGQWMIDSVIVRGAYTYPEWMMGRMSGIAQGQIHSPKLLKRGDQALGSNPYVRLLKPSGTLFSPDGAVVYTYIDEIKVNAIDGLLGLTTATDGKLLFTGEISLELANNFHRNESIFFDWKGNGTGNQDLSAGLTYPYLLRTKVGLRLNGNILRQDSSFVQREGQFGLSYQIRPGLHLNFNRIGFQATRLDQESQITTSKTTYALGLNFHQLDRARLPRKGLVLNMKLGAGNRSRADLALGTTYEWEISNTLFIPLSARQQALVHVKSRGLTGTDIRSEEYHRLGGLNGFRGKRENELEGSFYGLARLEYRFFWDVESFFFTSIDRLEIQSDIRQKFTSATLGLGLSAGNGIFLMGYALAKEDEANLELDRGLVHLGWVRRW